jgi:hypothetical protein
VDADDEGGGEMSVYVDDLMPCQPTAKWRWNLSCHLFADDIEELHRFASSLGLKRAWFQHKPDKLPHYDLNESTRTRAVGLGAVEVDRQSAVDIWRKHGWYPQKKAIEVKP